jgi:hypothetical protein
MNIGLDFDDTYTRDPEGWDAFIRIFVSRGHKVYCTTFRFPEQAQQVYDSIGQVIGNDNCYFTSYTAKRKYMQSNGIMIDVWIDDMPILIDVGVKEGVV